MNKYVLITLMTFACNPTKKEMHEHTNSLIESTSPYLLQHAHNPVDWKEWGPDALEQARNEDKPILVSIGYSSCHWCHVMEMESFEDTAVARIMNERFINIKVDREERPDVDQIYMDAVQAMGLQGGWPLNVFLTPDQRPFYGGTYFPKKGWVNLLLSIDDAFKNNREKIDESATAFTKNLQLKESQKYKLEGTSHRFTSEEIDSMFQKLVMKFDHEYGGIKKSPKFPMPSLWQFLAIYHQLTKDQAALDHFELTLNKIADGGIYDHIGGGFARYSTDSEWHVPHFEKMLYDNGQLLSLFANGYKITKSEKFKSVLLETTNWLKNEMLDESGGFYSALDADSEGEEGKFYVWDSGEVIELAGSNFKWIAEYYDIQPNGNWEGKNALRVVKSESEIIAKYDLTSSEFKKGIEDFKRTSLETRNLRTRPGLDNKIIAGWNGLTLSGLCETYQALEDSSVLELAKKNAAFIKANLLRDGILYRFPDKELEGFLEDYSAVIQSFIKYYETSFEREYLDLARQLTTRVEEKFFDESEQLYYFTSDESQSLIARKKELFDNVIPSSNSIMAWNLVHLGTHFYDDEVAEKGKQILSKVKDLAKIEPEYMSNWAMLSLELSQPFAEIVIIGPNALELGQKLNNYYVPNKIISGSFTTSDLSPFEHKTMINGETTIYVCYDKSCKLPVTTIEKALEQLGIQP